MDTTYRLTAKGLEKAEQYLRELIEMRRKTPSLQGWGYKARPCLSATEEEIRRHIDFIYDVSCT